MDERKADGITWRHLRRAGVGLNLSSTAKGLSLGIEDQHLVWVENTSGTWHLFYTPQGGMVLKVVTPTHINAIDSGRRAESGQGVSPSPSGE
ncbi:MAG: hypothetical protein HN849_08350 [Victivallales bacterium]|nr:hypothetical protein [Victivallales bacterium]MBT7299508.1 hypothetical protein [Victivallales bacterium]